MAFIRLAIIAAVVGAALRAQSITVIPNAPTTPPAPPGATAASTPPVLNGISGGGPVELGQSVTLSPLVYGSTADLSFQWNKNGTAIAGATNGTLVFSAVTATDTGSYTVRASNSGGSSVAATDLTVKPAAAPVITRPPSAQIVQVGQPATFSVIATGSYPRAYQWRRDGVAIVGATQVTYIIAAANTGDAASYSVVVANNLGTDTSAGAALTVNAATLPVISAGYPSDTSVTQGAQVSLGIYLTAGSSPYTYQWFKGGTPIPGATSANMTFTSVGLADAGKYSVAVTNAAGSATSREATFTVTPAVPVTVAALANQSVVQGQSVTFYASVSGSSPYTYQWLKNGTAIAGATSNSLYIGNAAMADAGSYSVVVTNILGSATSNPGTLMVTSAVPPTITTQPTSQTIAYNAQLFLTVNASGTAPLTFAWSKDDVPLANGNSASYYYSSATPAQSGNYTVTVSNAAGSVTSNRAQVVVAAAVAPAISTPPADQQVPVGTPALFSANVTSTGTGPLTLQWLKDGGPIPGANSNSYTLNAVKDTDAGTYRLVASGAGGSVTSAPAVLTVLPAAAPSVRWNSYNVSSVDLGGSTSFSVAGYSTIGGTPPFSYQWAKNGVPIPGATSATLDFRSVAAADYGTYTVTVANEGGIVTSPGMRLRPTVARPSYGANPTPWLDVAQWGDTVYFLAATPSRIERYDLAGERWLTTTSLGATQVPTAFVAAGEGLYIAYGRSIVRRSLDLATETAIANGTVDITQMFVYGPYLYYTASNAGQWVTNNYATLNRTTLQPGPGATVGYYGNPRQVAIAPSIGKGFLCTLGLSPSDIAMFSFAADGSSAAAKDSPYHGTMPIGDRAIVLPGDQYVTDTSGTVYRTSDLTYAGSFGEPFTDLAFLSDNTPVVLRGLRLATTRNDNFIELAGATLPQPALRLFARGTSVFAFGAAAGSTPYSVSKVNLGAFAAVASRAGTLPPPSRYSVDDAFVGSGNIVHIFSRTLQAFVRWNPATRSFLTSLPLRDAPAMVYHQPGNPRALLSYPDGAITELPLVSGGTEHTLANIGQYVRAIVDVGDLVSVNFSDWQDSGDGRLLLGGPNGPKFINTSLYESTGRAWLPGPRRLYSSPAFSSGNLQYEVITSAGALAAGSTGTSSPATPPIRFNADASLLATMNGRVFTADLGAAGVLSNDITDATWLGNTLYSIRNRNGQTEVQRWAPTTYLLATSAAVPGTPVRILRLSDSQLLVVSSNAGFLKLTLLNPDLSLVSQPNVAAFAGVYFAKLNGVGAGDIGIVLRADGTGVVLAYLNDARTALLATNVSIDGSGAFVAAGRDLANDTSRTIFGLVSADGTIVGSIPTLNATYSGNRTSGSLTPGYYPTVAVDGRSGAAYALIGADGQALVVSHSSTAIAGARGLIDPTGRLSTSSVTAPIAATFDATTGIAAVTATSGTMSVRFAGLREDIGSTARLVNISTRGLAGTGEAALIAGFVVAGNAPRPILLRAVGPTLAKFGIGGPLAAPHLALFRGSMLLGTSDSWGANANAGAIAAASVRGGAFALASDSADAALLTSLDPGAYTASVSGTAGNTGLALVEVYDVGDPVPATGTRLINIATRGAAASGDNALIAGIVVSGNAPKRILVRGVGPTLGTFGITGVLTDPVLTILAGSTTLLVNDDWGAQSDGVTASDIASTTAALGAFALAVSSKDAAMIVTLNPGTYTAQVTGKGVATGIALIEAYEVP